MDPEKSGIHRVEPGIHWMESRIHLDGTREFEIQNPTNQDPGSGLYIGRDDIVGQCERRTTN